MPRFKEVAARYMKIGERTFYPGDVIRTVSISERDALMLNSMTGTEPINGHGMTYELTTEKPEVKVQDANEKFVEKHIGVKKTRTNKKI